MVDLTGIEKLRQLARRLTVATRASQASWTESGRAGYEYSTPNATITVASVDGDGVAPFQLDVFDGTGALVDSIRSDEVSSARQDLEDLFHAARRQVGRVDEVLDGILGQLPPDPDDAPF